MCLTKETGGVYFKVTSTLEHYNSSLPIANHSDEILQITTTKYCKSLRRNIANHFDYAIIMSR